MRRGPWHQCGDKSQKLVQEQLENDVGVGAILSPRDVSFDKAEEYAQAYKNSGAEVLIDPQFYLPEFSNKLIQTYPFRSFRLPVAELIPAIETRAHDLETAVAELNQRLGTDAIIAPAIIYEAGRTDITRLNQRLFEIGKNVGQELGLPTYSTVILGRSCTVNSETTDQALSNVTSLDADGWYFGFEFAQERIPTTEEDVYRASNAALTLALTEAPVLHAFAGPMALLSLGIGATGAGIGHSQNLWSFNRARWEPPQAQGGGGGQPARFFSSSLWGTIIYPDETEQLSPELRAEVMTTTDFSDSLDSGVPAWSRWNSNKHLVSAISSVVSDMAAEMDPRQNIASARARLENAVDLHERIRASGIRLRDDTAAYQNNWISALDKLIAENAADFEFLDLLS